MQTKILNDKKITLRRLSKSDLKLAPKFQELINSLIEEDAKLLMNEKASIKDEKDFINSTMSGEADKRKVYLFAECDNKIVGASSIEIGKWRKNHIGKFGIIVSKEYRGIGLGAYLMSEIIKLAKKELSPKPKIIQLEVYTNNKPALYLYKKLGFKIVGKIPKQIQYKGKLISEFIMIRKA